MKCSYDDVQDMIYALDLYSRLLMGQYDEIPFRRGFTICYSHDNPDLLHNFLQLREVFIPCLPPRMNTSLGIWSPETPIVAIRAYDIQQALRYQISWHNHKDGEQTYTRNFDVPVFRGEWDIHADDWQSIHAVLIKHGCYPEYQPEDNMRWPWECPVYIREFYKDYVVIETSDTADHILNDARCVYEMIENNCITDAFSVLYPDADVDTFNAFTHEIEKLLSNGNPHRFFHE